jgi:integrase/recombinase XerD
VSTTTKPAAAATLPALLQRFFTDRLVAQMEASPNTVAGYRDAFRLLLRFASQRLGRPPTRLEVADLDASLVGEFLAHVESSRGNTARSRNTRLAAIRSFFRYVAMEEPAHLLHCQRILAMPGKRYVRRAVDFLDAAEADALAAAPDRSTWVGRRDHALLLVATQTGLRASELVGLRRCDLVAAGTGAHLRCEGKGRKQRCTPLGRDTVKVLAAWLKERGGGGDHDPLFPTRRGTRMSRDALEHLVRRHVLAAARSCPSLAGKRVSPHVLRHTAAMRLLHHGVDQTVIALWLGHESVGTTQVYVHADLRLKERALARVATETTSKPGRYRPDDQLLAFLEGL